MKKKKKSVNRYTVVIIVMFIIFAAITSRLIYLQIFKYEDYTEKANTSSRRLVTEKAPRGKIYDSQGNLLATNKQVYTLTFTQTDASSKSFYTTMKQVFKLLDDNKDSQQDNLNLKIDDKGEPYFDFNVSSDDSKRALEIRFKRDRGMNDDVKKVLFKNKQELTDGDESKIDDELLKISAKDTFYYMVKLYSMYDMLNPTSAEKEKYKRLSGKDITEMLLKHYSINDIRRYMLVKDAIKMQSFSGFKPVTIAANIKKDTAFIFYQKLNSLTGVDVSLEPMRYYPYGQYNLASGVIGYVASIDSTKKDRYEERGYDVSTDVIGKAGVESAFESVLRGSTGGTTIKVDSQGRKTEELFDLEPSPGENVHLSIDKNIQYSAEKALQERMNYVQTQINDPQMYKISKNFNTTRGAAVAIEAKTGRVLAMVSNPGYDANIFSEPGKLTPELSKQFFAPDYESFGKMLIAKYNLGKSVDELFPKDSNGNRQDKYDLYPKPFYNYATMGLIPPGSTFKPLISVAALEEGVVHPNDTLYGKKYFDTHSDILGSWAPADEHEYGIVDLKRALAVSCNFYYYEMAIRMYQKHGQNTEALDTLGKYAWQLGMGTDPNSKQKGSTGIEIGENFGQTYNYEYFKSQTLYYSKYEFVEAFSKGSYGSYNFVPLDIAAKDDDSDKLKATKQAIKDAITDVLKNSTSRSVKLDGFETKIKGLLNDLESNSKDFGDRVKAANNSNNKYSQKTVVNAIEQFIFDKNGAINTPAELVNAAIGQGVNNFSLVQLASYISTVANGGTRYKVHLVDDITDSTGKVIKQYKPEVLGKISIKPENLAAIKEGMSMVNNGTEEGTARAHFVGFPIKTAGKTGTATYKETVGNVHQEDYGRSDYSVYVSFAPVDDPQIVVAVVMYDGYQGNMGAPVARAIYETYFRDQIKQQYPDYKPMFDYALNPPLEDVKDDNLK
jgi:penicillin-binding protein 2